MPNFVSSLPGTIVAPVFIMGRICLVALVFALPACAPQSYTPIGECEGCDTRPTELGVLDELPLITCTRTEEWIRCTEEMAQTDEVMFQARASLEGQMSLRLSPTQSTEWLPLTDIEFNLDDYPEFVPGSTVQIVVRGDLWLASDGERSESGVAYEVSGALEDGGSLEIQSPFVIWEVGFASRGDLESNLVDVGLYSGMPVGGVRTNRTMDLTQPQIAWIPVHRDAPALMVDKLQNRDTPGYYIDAPGYYIVEESGIRAATDEDFRF